jgi:hypothetical protein
VSAGHQEAEDSNIQYSVQVTPYRRAFPIQIHGLGGKALTVSYLRLGSSLHHSLICAGALDACPHYHRLPRHIRQGTNMRLPLTRGRPNCVHNWIEWLGKLGKLGLVLYP